MSDMSIDLIGDEELLKIIHVLEVKTQHKVLKKVVGDVAQKTYVKELRKATPVKSGNLRRSMGKVAGKSKKNATVFAGPRMGGAHKGWVANILEHAKDKRRVPKGQSLVWRGFHFKSVGPIKKRTHFKRTLLSTERLANEHMFKSIRTIMEREIKKFAKR